MLPHMMNMFNSRGISLDILDVKGAKYHFYKTKDSWDELMAKGYFEAIDDIGQYGDYVCIQCRDRQIISICWIDRPRYRKIQSVREN